MPEEARENRVSWPYTSFRSILNLIQRLEDAKAIPPRIDRSFLGGSEGQKTQVIAALKFMGLIEDNGEVTTLFQALVNDPKERPNTIGQMVQKLYPEATRLSGIHATTKQLEESFTGLGGDTLRKAMTFYLHMAKFGQIPVSKHFKIPHGQGRARGARRNSQQTATTDDTRTPYTPPPPPASDAKAQYIAMLMERAKTADGALDEKLLDRIERVLGLAGAEPE
jgi:hypothetical protein